MKILTLGSFPVSWGYGATIQYKNIARGLVENKCECVHICDYPDETLHNVSGDDKELFEKINVVGVYPNGSKFAVTRWGRLLQRHLFRLILWIKFFHNMRKFKSEVIILFGCYPFLSMLIKIFTRKPLYCLRGEYPLYGQKVRWYNFGKFIAERFFGYRCIDGMFVMTDNLKKYYAEIAPKNCRFMVMPAIVDVLKFDKVEVNEKDIDYVTYCGDFGGNKDGVADLLSAFITIADKFPAVKLKLIGSTSEQHTLKKLYDMSKQANLADRIIFTGRLDHQAVAYNLKNSRVLALARPANKQAEGGFPSKVGEYLSTGNPVLVTRVGEIPLYLHDEINAFSVEPGDIGLFADKLAYILDNPEKAEKVGAAGKELAMQMFDYRSVAGKMIDFMRVDNM